MNPRLSQFAGGLEGEWLVERMTAVTGEPLTRVPRLSITSDMPPKSALWVLKGVAVSERCVTRSEKDLRIGAEENIGRPGATCGAVISIRKAAAWWSTPQDERRSIMDDRSMHIRPGLKYLPAIARRLHHCRDLEHPEAFDFITYFDYAAEHTRAFEDLVGQLRETEEWKYVDREVDIRLIRWA